MLGFLFGRGRKNAWSIFSINNINNNGEYAMKRTIIIGCILATTALAAVNASAGDWYVSATAGQSEVDLDISSGPGYSIDDEDTTYGINLGYRLNQYWAVEAGYLDLGEASIKATEGGADFYYGGSYVEAEAGTKATAEADGWTLGLVGTYPVTEKFDLYAKAGVYKWDVDYKVSGSGWIDGEYYEGSASASEDGSDIYYSLGGKYNFTETVAVGVEFARYEVDDADVDNISATLTYSF